MKTIPVNTIKTILEASKNNHHIDLLDAEILLAAALKVNRAHLMAFPEKEISLQSQAYKKIKHYFYRRQLGEPVAYILKKKEFWSKIFKVNRHTLIPRPETELLIEIILDFFNKKNKKLRFLELGTGTGAVGITIAKLYPESWVTAVDISKKALGIARQNQLNHAAENIEFIHSDWFSGIDLTQKYHVIMSNPPYLAVDDPHLKNKDLCFEPKLALIAGQTGLESIEWIISQAKKYLFNNGIVLLEHGYHHSDKVAEIFKKNGFDDIILKKDLNHLPRVTTAKLSGISVGFEK